jgi:hypothetical protein
MVITNNNILEKFLYFNSLLKRDSFRKDNLYQEEWIKFNENLGGSLVSFYKFILELYKTLEIDYEQSRFYSFYADHILSNPSNQIFTETPRSSSFDLFPIDSKKIAFDANKLLTIANAKNKKSINDDEFNIYFQKLYIETFCYYDFVFSIETQEGVFTSFNYDKNAFKTYKDIIESQVIDKDNFKDNLNKLKAVNIKIALNINDNQNQDSEIILSDLKLHEIYKNYVEKIKKLKNKNNRTKTINLEIFTYILSHKLWKIERIYQRTPEFIKDNDKENDNFINKTTSYIKEQLEIIEKFYDRKYSLKDIFLSIYKSDKKFITNYIFNELLEDIEENIKENDKIEEKYFITINNNIENKIKIHELINKYIIDNDKNERYKFFRLIQDGAKEEITFFLDYFYKFIKENTKGVDDYSFVGILRSGSFLAHAMHIMKLADPDISEEKKYKNSYFLITYPFISLVPRKFLNRENNKNLNIVYIDEAIKSGYSLAISDIYRERILYLKKYDKNNNDIAFAISNFTDYKNKIIDNDFINMEYKTICNVSAKNKKLTAEQVTNQVDINKNFDWKSFIESIKNINKERIKEQAIVEIGSKQRYDILNNLADSKTLFTIATFFADKLHTQLNIKKAEKYIIPIYAGSPEGNLLIDTMIFIFKILFDYENFKFYLNGKNFSNEIKDDTIIKTVFVDITIVSGSTKNRAWNLDVSEYIKQKNTEFDYTCSIYNKNPKDKDIFIFNHVGITNGQ